MSSLRNAVKRKTHKERGQLQERKKLGLLEKHKDYVQRARDYHKKQSKLNKLRLKASFRNPDEFYFRMHNERTEDGIHVSKNNHASIIDNDVLKTMKTQDLAYMNFKKQIDSKKVDRLQDSLHFIEAEKKNKHTIFVEDQQCIRRFDPAEHFDTVPELLSREYNRPRKNALKHMSIIDASTETRTASNKKSLTKSLKRKNSKYVELHERIVRASKITKRKEKLELERNLQAKGKKYKVSSGTSSSSVPVYKWKKQRQK